MGPPDTTERRPVGGNGAQDADNVNDNGNARYALTVFAQHAALLAASAIMPEVSRARGYVSVDTKRRLDSAGFKHYQQRVPGLLLPLHSADTSTWGYQYRPDSPRTTKAGSVIKYETPAGQRNGIDVPPGAAGALADPAVPLLVTEGTRKADSAVSAGLACVALPGVWGWRGSNAQGGKLAVADWHDVALNGRRLVLAFDSDVTRKRPVQAALRQLAAYLAAKGARVEYLHLPDLGDGKTGLDDYLAAEGADGIWALVRPDPPPLAEPAPQPAAPAPARPRWHGDAAALLSRVHSFLSGYVAWPSGHTAVAVTLWAAHTHLAAAFDSTPRPALLSPEKQCGKTRALELLALLCDSAETLSDASAAYLYRRIGAGPVTILLDEADAVWRRGKADETAEALRSVVNAGHRKGASVGRVEMNGQGANLVRFNVYAPAALAAIGALPDTILDRAVVVRMRRRAPDETVREYRERVTRPEGEALREELAGWAAGVAQRVGDPWPDMPDGVTDRPADVWEPLVSVADLAGGDWPDLARAACTALVTGGQDEAASVGVRLLADLRDVFSDSGAGPHSQLSTEAIRARLHALDESPWGDWYGRPLTARDLAKLLNPYGVKPKVVRFGESTARGYRREDFSEPWRRYLAGVSVTSETSVTSLARHVTDVTSVTDAPGAGVADDADRAAPPPGDDTGPLACDTRGCEEPARQYADGRYCPRHAVMLGARESSS
jgi:hypothetical protein